MQLFHTMSGLRISLASPEQIRSWSYGEVTQPATIDYRSQKPVKDGLFCERIFGPTEHWTCACKKYRRKQDPGFVCENCGVELAPATVRRERMGHIVLAAPVIHPWYMRDRTICTLLNFSLRQLLAVASYQHYLVLSINESKRSDELSLPHTEDEETTQLLSLLTHMHPGDFLEAPLYHALTRSFSGIFHAQTGAEAIREALTLLDLASLAAQLRQEVKIANTQQKKVIKRLHLVEAFLASGIQPGWMVLSTLPVLPPELRPIVLVDNNRLASADSNDLYLRIIHRNNRLKHFIEHHAPEAILNNERRLLQAACNALFDNRHLKKKILGSHGQSLKSLTDLIEGKQGIFRHNLLGKRVDYSGRSVIVAGPNLQLHECGLPKVMACELFKPFIMSKLLDRRYAQSPRIAKRMVERRDPLIWDILAEVMFERVILLNRAPTLHRLSIQAFQPRLIEGKAIQLHPLVCSGFNADFDGDQMAIHVPLSEKAQEEARLLLLSTNNLRHPASGEPVAYPSQEIVLGCFYLTEDRPSTKHSTHIFTDMQEALLAYEHGFLDLHTSIAVRMPNYPLFNAPPPAKPHIPEKGHISTTIGRLLFNDLLPEQLRYRNYPMTKELLKNLIAECQHACGNETTAHLLDAIKRRGYAYATKSGISFSLFDIRVPPERETLITQGQTRRQELDEQYHQGELTYDEWYHQAITLWTEITERISEKLKDSLDPFGSLMTIVKSGATKAKFQQIRQLSGIRGLMASPSGRILPIPVLSNFLLGLLVWEIYIAASGARKGFMDRSLQTAASGYLTRRLVEAGMEVIITEEDCGTSDGLLITQQESQRLGLPLHTRIGGRVLAQATRHLAAGTLLNEQMIEDLLTQGIEQVQVRSPLCCQTPNGLCQYCYGSDLATGALVSLGRAVGVIAGQSIGEPGTQLTMRTFHAGGIANNASDITLGLPRVEELFEARTPAHAAILAHHSGKIQRITTEPQTGKRRITLISSSVYEIPLSSSAISRDLSISSDTPPQATPSRKPPSPHRRQGPQTIYQEEEPGVWVYTLPNTYPLTIQEGQTVEIGMPLTEGPLNPQELLELVGHDRTQRYLIEEVQRIYRGTGVYIHDKHLEVIIRQMLRYVQVSEGGDTPFLPGEIIDRFTYLHQIASILAQGGNPGYAQQLLLGLKRTVLLSHSWIAAASFQETSRVIAAAAIRSQQDPLTGLKALLIVGKKLPALAEKGEASATLTLVESSP